MDNTWRCEPRDVAQRVESFGQSVKFMSGDYMDLISIFTDIFQTTSLTCVRHNIWIIKKDHVKYSHS